MRKLGVALIMAVLFAGPAAAAVKVSVISVEQASVMATVRQFVRAFNQGDAKALAATCANETSILDEFPPHEWHGAGAISKWVSDYDTDAKQKGITEGFVTVGTPRHIDITGDRAYVVAPADYAFKQKGAPVKESGSTFTLVLQHGDAGWRITGWAWAKQ